MFYATQLVEIKRRNIMALSSQTNMAKPFTLLSMIGRLLLALFLTLSTASVFSEAAVEDIGQLEALAPGFGSPVTAIGRNIDGGSVFTNLFRIYKEGQFFLSQKLVLQFEKPRTQADSLVEFDIFYWCGDLTFTGFVFDDDGKLGADEKMPLGFTAHCLLQFAISREEVLQAGADLPNENFNTGFVDATMSAVFVPQHNGIEMNLQTNSDNGIFRFLDDGRRQMPFAIWEVHDDGDADPTANTSAFSGHGQYNWIDVSEMTTLVNMDEADLTPTNFTRMYDEEWKRNNEVKTVNENEQLKASASNGSSRNLGSSTRPFFSVALHLVGL